MENKIPQSTINPGDFDFPSAEWGHKDMEYDPINDINSSDESEDYNDTKYDLINEINSDEADDESDDQKESSENPYAPNLDFLDQRLLRKLLPSRL